MILQLTSQFDRLFFGGRDLERLKRSLHLTFTSPIRSQSLLNHSTSSIFFHNLLSSLSILIHLKYHQHLLLFTGHQEGLKISSKPFYASLLAIKNALISSKQHLRLSARHQERPSFIKNSTSAFSLVIMPAYCHLDQLGFKAVKYCHRLKEDKKGLLLVSASLAPTTLGVTS